MSGAISQAQQLLQRGDIQSATTTLEQAERGGDALAARELAVWYLTGQPLRRDLRAARSMFERAAALGDDVSAPVVRAFVAVGVGGPADWRRALDLLGDAAGHDPQAATQLSLINAMPLGDDGDPVQDFDVETVSQTPEVRRFPALFTPTECAYLMNAANPLFEPSVVVDPRTGQQVPDPVRTSMVASFPLIDENPAIHALNRRLAAASGTDVRAGEPLQILRYAPGQQYRRHSDALPNVAPGEQRVLTFLIYLSNDYDGGETTFPALGLSFRGEVGDGLLFRNASSKGVPDPRALHAGEPVTRGVKFLASRWIRAAPLVLE